MDPADLVVLPPVSPLIVDKLPVVIDALVTNMVNRPTFLPPDTDFAAIAAVKIAEHYGFDNAKTTAGRPPARRLAPGPRGHQPDAWPAQQHAAHPRPRPAPLAGERSACCTEARRSEPATPAVHDHPKHSIRRPRDLYRRRRRNLPPCYGWPRQSGVSAKRAPSALP